MTFSISNSEAITALDAMVDACDSGSTNPQATLVIYSGTPPARVDAALSGNTVLAQLDMTNPAFGNAVDVPASNLARATASAISDDTAADADGTATFYRILDRDDTPRQQGGCGVVGSGAELELNSVNLVTGANVEVSSLVIDLPESA